MRILIHGINFAPELTGIGKYSGEMAAWLAARGHEVRVVTAPPYYPAWRIGEGYRHWGYRRETIAGTDVWRCPLWVPAKPTGGRRLAHLFSFAASSLPVMLRQVPWRPHVVMGVAPALVCAPQAWLTARLAGASAWLHIQDFEVDAAFELGLFRSRRLQRQVERMEAMLLRRFDRVTAVADAMVRRLLAKGVSTGRTGLLLNWVDTERIRPDAASAAALRQELGIPVEQVVALYSGNMGEKQGVEVLVEAARRLADRPGILFVLCGDGAARRRLEQQAQGMGNVRFLPLQPVERLNALLNLADVHLLPQRGDAADLVMPSKLTGILACGGAVVATAAPDTELGQVVTRSGGLLCPPGNGAQLAASVADLAADEPRRRRMGCAARSYAEEHLDREAILCRLERQLEGLRRPPRG